MESKDQSPVEAVSVETGSVEAGSTGAVAVRGGGPDPQAGGAPQVYSHGQAMAAPIDPMGSLSPLAQEAVASAERPAAVNPGAVVNFGPAVNPPAAEDSRQTQTNREGDLSRRPDPPGADASTSSNSLTASPAGTYPLVIDPEVRDLIPPMVPLERWLLEQSLASGEGCREALVVWAETGVLLDGHNRYEICARLGIQFNVRPLSFPDREAALQWVIQNQLGRRNLKQKHFTLLLGKLYNREKRQGRRSDRVRAKELLSTGPKSGVESGDAAEVAGPDGSVANGGVRTHGGVTAGGGAAEEGGVIAGGGATGETCGNISHKSEVGRTARRLAMRHGVDEKTVRNAGKFAANLDKLRTIDPELERQVVMGTAPSIRTIARAAQLVERDPQKAAALLRGDVWAVDAPGAPDSDERPDGEGNIQENASVAAAGGDAEIENARPEGQDTEPGVVHQDVSAMTTKQSPPAIVASADTPAGDTEGAQGSGLSAMSGRSAEGEGLQTVTIRPSAGLGLELASGATLPPELAVRFFIAFVDMITKREDPTQGLPPELAVSFRRAVAVVSSWQVRWQAAQMTRRKSAMTSGDSPPASEPAAQKMPPLPPQWWQAWNAQQKSARGGMHDSGGIPPLGPQSMR